MRQTLKISLALLVSVAVFAAFAVLAFTGLFDLLQVNFFQPRMLREREKSLAVASELIERYHRLNLERFGEPLKQPYVASAFSSFGQESREDIFNRANYFGKLLDEYPALQGVRFLSPDGKIHFSTFPADIKSKGKDQIRYYPYQEVENGETALPLSALLVARGGTPQLLIDGRANRLIYSFPTGDPKGGTAAFYFSKNGLAEVLLRDPRLDFRELVLIDRLGALLGVSESEKDLIAPVVSTAWSRRSSDGLSSDTVVLSGEGGAQEKQILLSLPAGAALAGWLIPYAAFELAPLMKAVILASVLLTVFLLVFLLFNLRQDPVLVLSQRIKRFQLEILQEFIEGRKEVDWRRWHDELTSGRAELGSRIKRGIGRLPAGKEVEIDALVDRSWDEIIRIIEARIGQPARERVDIGAIEELIQKALDRGRITVEASASVPALPAVASPARPPARREMLEVEEIGVEEVTEAKELEAAPAAEAKEAVEELEEAEGVEEAEEVGEAEEAGSEGPAEAARGEAKAGPVPAEAPEEEEAEAVEELAVEEVTEAAPSAPVAQKAAPSAPARVPPVPPEAPREAEALEELTQVREIETLPLEPQEQLEELPQAEVPSSSPPPPVRSPSEAEIPAELEELEAAAKASPVSSASPAAGPAAAGEADETEPEELEVLEEEPKAIQELLESKEELEIEAAPEQGWSGLQDLLGKGLIRLFSTSEVEALVAETRTSVVMENGVYRIKEELRTGTARKASRGLKALAEQLLSVGVEPAIAESEPGINELLGGDLGADLAAELEGLRSKSREARLPDRQRHTRIQFSGSGLDYDQFVTHFGDGDTNALKSLVEISGKIQAVSAAVLQEVDGSFCSVLRVGLMGQPAIIRFAAGEPFYDRFLGKHQAVIVLERPALVPDLGGKFHREDLKYMQAALFLPAVYQRVPAFLFLGLPSRKGLEFKEIIARLDIY